MGHYCCSCWIFLLSCPSYILPTQNAGALLSFLSGYSWYVPDAMSSFHRTLTVSTHPASWVPWPESCAAITTYFARKSSTWRSYITLMVSTDSMVAGTGVPMLPSCTSVVGTDRWKSFLTLLSLLSVPVSVLLPGLAHSIAPLQVNVNSGVLHLYCKSLLCCIWCARSCKTPFTQPSRGCLESLRVFWSFF